MIIKVDRIEAAMIGQRNNSTFGIRFYYTVAGYSNLLLVAQGASLEQFQGKIARLLWNYDSIDSTIACDLFPNAPQAWRNEQIIQASITIKGRMKGAGIPLSEALKKGYKHDHN